MSDFVPQLLSCTSVLVKLQSVGLLSSCMLRNCVICVCLQRTFQPVFRFWSCVGEMSFFRSGLLCCDRASGALFRFHL